MKARSRESRLWGPLILLHAIGLPAALALGVAGNRAWGPAAGAAAVGLTLCVISLGVWHAVRVLLAAGPGE